MGQALHRAVPPGLVPALASNTHHDDDDDEHSSHSPTVMEHHNSQEQENDDEELEEDDKFPDLGHLPPEVALQVLKNLNATDLCLASCVWQQLASDNILWQGLCRHVSNTNSTTEM